MCGPAMTGESNTVATSMLPAAEECFDVEALITQFLANSSADVLELPRLSTGQRKQARKLTDQHPEIVCESFGFGPERRLHLFKNKTKGTSTGKATATDVLTPKDNSNHNMKCFKDSAISEPSHSVSVKNTFIDDWIASQEGAALDPVISRSMPHGMFSKYLDLGSRKLELSPIKEGSGQFDDPPTSSTSASGDEANTSASSPAPIIPDLPVELQEVKIRNTFVHFQSMHVDERVVQSMPHGMFSQILVADRLAQECMDGEPVTASTAPDAAAVREPAATGALVGGDALFPGTEVVIEGLLKQPAFNGLSGVVQSLDEETGRYNVLLTSPVSGRQWTKLKKENLRFRVPPPPSHVPMLELDKCDSDSSGLPEMPDTPMWHEDFCLTAPLMLTALV